MHSRKSKEIWWASEEQLGQMGSRREMEMKGIVPDTDEERGDDRNLCLVFDKPHLYPQEIRFTF